MKIKLSERMAGPEGNFPSGTVLTLDDAKAQMLIDGGYAVSLEPVAARVEEPKAVKKELKPEPKPKSKKAVSK